MTQKEMIELIQQHHPHIRETEARKLLNRAMDSFCADTDMLKTSFTDTTIAGTRYYGLDNAMLKISRVTLTDAGGQSYHIPRLIGHPEIEDEDLI